MEAHGITGSLLNWIGEWLNGSLQRVVLNGNTSTWLYVISGLPQGSVLGPLLFLMFINDIDNYIVNKILKFADNTKLVGAVTNNVDAEKLRSDLKKNFMIGLLIGKCCLMLKSAKYYILDIIINNIITYCVKSVFKQN